MAVIDTLLNLDITSSLSLLVAVVVLGHLVPYIVDPHALKSYPGPLLAKLSDLWLGRVAVDGHRSEVVHELHKKYGESCSPLFRWRLLWISLVVCVGASE